MENAMQLTISQHIILGCRGNAQNYDKSLREKLHNFSKLLSVTRGVAEVVFCHTSATLLAVFFLLPELFPCPPPQTFVEILHILDALRYFHFCQHF